MKYSEAGFRAIYKHMCLFPMCSAVKKALKFFPSAEKANCALVYGYIDCEAGMTLAVLAAGCKDEHGSVFFDGNDTIKSMIRIGAVQDEPFEVIDDSALQARYAKKIAILDHYAAPDDVEKTRGITILDSCRDSGCIDDILVYLTKTGLQPEGVWVRLSGMGNSCVVGGGRFKEPHHIYGLKGKLLNEPYQDFGYHVGNEICVLAFTTEDKKAICHSDEKLIKELSLLFKDI